MFSGTPEEFAAYRASRFPSDTLHTRYGDRGAGYFSLASAEFLVDLLMSTLHPDMGSSVVNAVMAGAGPEHGPRQDAHLRILLKRVQYATSEDCELVADEATPEEAEMLAEAAFALIGICVAAADPNVVEGIRRGLQSAARSGNAMARVGVRRLDKWIELIDQVKKSKGL